jgi:hypothetical protein
MADAPLEAPKVLLVLDGPVGLVLLVLEGPGGRPLEALSPFGRPRVRSPGILNNTQN